MNIVYDTNDDLHPIIQAFLVEKVNYYICQVTVRFSHGSEVRAYLHGARQPVSASFFSEGKW